MALTIKEIENARPREKRYKMADGGGLCLLVSPSGAKLWVWRYRIGGAEKNMAFGEYALLYSSTAWVTWLCKVASCCFVWSSCAAGYVRGLCRAL